MSSFLNNSGKKPSNKTLDNGKNSKTGDRKPGNVSRIDAKVPKPLITKLEMAGNQAIIAQEKTGNNCNARADRCRVHSGSDAKQNGKSSRQNPQIHRARPANSVNKPSSKTENKKKETVVMQPTLGVVHPNDDPNILQLDVFSNVF